MANEVSPNTSSSKALLKEIHDAALLCLSSPAQVHHPSLQAAIVQTKGALGMLKRMAAIPFREPWDPHRAPTSAASSEAKFNLNWSNASWTATTPVTPNGIDTTLSEMSLAKEGMSPSYVGVTPDANAPTIISQQ
eukprot:Protomagalhaensia_sp_Gyna_25__2484@NODE_2392_length_1109_cov_204_950467_g1982_i0_p1_GENE_NODE_2392_length_1109_cov_204_950467_g1982_i0NODE_2392_length_1109_cov_204_950467_g1982_i0_p1_ORF_typecomplete_len135_score18_68_NODE_2392_length_1109_cov_204_950467_g1982_i059463